MTDTASRLIALLEHDLTREDLDSLSQAQLEHLDVLMQQWRELVFFRVMNKY
ncbi:hypothetical protein U5801_01015 [Lamprobacter modestohalophilus]|uniref:hypothetical protein n=1 Tax=Lamprobacter modestohalophilus TaxID=1064514 RepID=UPI002ADEC0BC|nr:hypothetical protein [Lamprobacter modestohalophilus]MEA1048404.1 hypothetical protein [Lamprobacter modestohalophilus]